MGIIWSQLFPPPATLTEKNLPDLTGKVFVVTGGTSGIGRELASILYKAGGKVYIVGRSKSDTETAINSIEASHSNESHNGQLRFLYLDLSDLATIKPAVESFMNQETKLDVLWNNAGVSLPPLGSKSQQGTELMMATNCVGPYLLTKLLLPSLQAGGAQTSGSGPARVVWTSSLVVETSAPKGGILLEELDKPPADKTRNYVTSKVGNWFLASGFGRDEDIISVTLNPGQLKTNLLRYAPKWMSVLSSPLLHDAKLGAYTELWAGLSSEVTQAHNGSYIVPWGRFHPSPREDLLSALKSKQEGGTGQAQDFTTWCDMKIADYL